MRRFAVVSSLAVFMSLPLAAQERMEPHFQREAVGYMARPAAPRIAEKTVLSPAATLAAAMTAAPDRVHQMQQWNRSGKLPAMNGFARSIGEPVAVRIGNGVAAMAANGAQPFARGIVTTTARGVVWGASFRVANAWRLRLHLQDVVLPDGATLWVYSDSEAPIAFGKELVDTDGSLWTPSIGGGVVHLEIETPHGTEASFQVNELLELIGADPVPNDLPTCLVDATCVNASTLNVVDSYRRAVAQLQYVKNGQGFVCSGALLNDRNSTGTPYLLTANHCFSTTASATSLEAYWDYKTSICNGVVPPFASLQRSNGSSLLATNANSDFTFVRLNSIPSNRVMLGWDPSASAVPQGTVIHRISFPFPDTFLAPASQQYSSRIVNTSSSSCSILPRPRFLYAITGPGGQYGGSSGAPAILAGGYAIGQLYGACGPAPSDGCDARNYSVDGAFSTTYAGIQSFLEGATPAQCVSSATNACLANKRFGVSVTWKTSGGQTGNGQAIEYTADSALFWFFGSTNIEMLAKIVNACVPDFNRFWFFGAATTNVEYTITVKDYKTGQVKTYSNPQGRSAPAITDTNAFATCP